MGDKLPEDVADNKEKVSRREFIKSLGVIGLALTLPSLIRVGKAFGADTTAGNEPIKFNIKSIVRTIGKSVQK